jgi:hypothetical protein
MTVSLGQREIGVGRICKHLINYVYFISLFIPTLFSRLLGKISSSVRGPAPWLTAA